MLGVLVTLHQPSDVTMIGLFGIRKKRRLFDTGSGLDKKHGSYDRYLARKKGWIFRNEFKQYLFNNIYIWIELNK